MPHSVTRLERVWWKNKHLWKNYINHFVFSIEGEFVPKPGDDVSYKATPIPPKMEKMQAIHVRIVNPAEGVKHERWDTPLSHSPGTPGS